MDAGYIKYIYKPSPELIKTANQFSENLDKRGVVYGDKRNQNDPDIRINQSMIGKIAEVAVEEWANKSGYTVIKGVDWEIYNANQKNFSSDIILLKNFKLVSVSVKSSPQRYGDDYTEYMDGTKILCELPRQYTYTKQLKNNDGRGGTDKGDHDVYIFCNWDRIKDELEVYAWLKSEYVDKMLIKPFKKELKEIKGCIMQITCGASGDSPLKEFPCGLDEFIKRQKEQHALFS